MTSYTTKFKKRIGFSNTITFNDLAEVLRRTASTFPFENTSIMAGDSKPITKQLIEETLLDNSNGGVCYHLNPLLYYVLKEEGLNVTLLKGNVFDHGQNTWSSSGDTHIFILLTHNQKYFLLDTGFGNNLPLKPVPLSGEEVKSANGFFRITYNNCEYILTLKKNGINDWKMGYKFSIDHPVQSMEELTNIQEIIMHSDDSPFNKGYLFTSIREKETVTLTESSFTINVSGNITKKRITEADFIQLAKEVFGIYVKRK